MLKSSRSCCNINNSKNNDKGKNKQQWLNAKKKKKRERRNERHRLDLHYVLVKPFNITEFI